MYELALAEWSLLPAEYSHEEMERLALAWVRRERFKATLIAAEVGRMLGGGKRETPADDLWAMIERESDGGTSG